MAYEVGIDFAEVDQGNKHVHLSVKGDCIAIMDLVLVLDRSSALTNETWHGIMLPLITEMLQQLEINAVETRVAIVSYADTAKVEAYFSDIMDGGNLTELVLGIQHTGGGTNTPAALDLVYNEVLVQERGHRAGSQRVVAPIILLTHGPSTYGSPKTAGQRLFSDKQGIVFAVGLGDNVNASELAVGRAPAYPVSWCICSTLSPAPPLFLFFFFFSSFFFFFFLFSFRMLRTTRAT